ncbi:Ricin-type beta-trefoil lectin domain-containing protein [Nocardia amikacinitolerans]|uniref:Ricin-type beta-trefoil lectin domain-containing protein n=1 Tax=Nocardia amikacinitolerans TaxID=756689 RepID=A0A285L3Q5_9NOCA|nr:S8 family serine peptidase [Nocardia amikacinitolerans]SNY78697.1 Ricin-type beta-trefoil lectin domain-containing protein [Nocardia amikacinitolerans]
MTRPEVSSEAQYNYVDKTNGHGVSFTPKPDEAMVTFQGLASETAINEIVAAAPLLSVSQGFNLDHGFAAVYLDPAVTMDTAARSLAEQPIVANSIPVMIDENGASRYFLPDEFTVQFRHEIDSTRAEAIIEENGGAVVVRQRTPGYYTVAVPAGHGLFETIREFAELTEVAFAEPSEVSFNSALAYIPDDPDFGRLWGLRNTGQTVNGTAGTAGADIAIADAWDLTRGDPDIVIAVIDTGADLDHDDLQANILDRGTEDWDFSDAADRVPEDENSGSHGTHVCGTVAAVDNAVGVIGVAPRCRLMPLRINLTAGQNQNRADAINYVSAQATAHPNRRYVINCSWRMNGDHAGVRTAIENAVDNNIVVVFAAGNDGVNTDTSPQFPGVYPQVIAVAALDQQDRRGTFSATQSSNFGTNVDVAAPGVNIWSTTRNNTHGLLGGTSMAAPHVAGLAALIWSRNTAMTNQRVRQIIEESCDNIDEVNPGFVGMLGRGRINAHAAVDLAIQTVRGRCTIQQRSNYRFLDAYTSQGEDFAAVTRPAQNNDSQRWMLLPVASVYTIQQKSSGRFLDAHETSSRDFAAVTRPAQNNDSQRWVYWRIPGDADTATLQQVSTGRFLDAHTSADNNFAVVTRPAQHNDSQRWTSLFQAGGGYTVQQKSSLRFLDAYTSDDNDFAVVTRPAQQNDTQRWVYTHVGFVYSIQHVRNNRFLDAHGNSDKDFAVVTRSDQDNDSQRWVLLPFNNDTFTIQQLSSRRFIDAHQSTARDFAVVTRPAQNNDTQRWVIREDPI